MFQDSFALSYGFQLGGEGGKLLLLLFKALIHRHGSFFDVSRHELLCLYGSFQCAPVGVGQDTKHLGVSLVCAIFAERENAKVTLPVDKLASGQA